MNGNSVHAEVAEEVRRIASVLASRVDELAQSVAAAVRAEVDFYKRTGVVTNDELLTSSTDNLQYALKGLEAAGGFDPSPAVATGAKRAAAGVPLPAVMDAYRTASHHLWDAVVQIAIQAAPSGYTSTKKARDGKCQRVKVKMAKVKGLPLKATFRTCY